MDTPLNKIWKNRPDLIRSYYEIFPSHQRLCDEIKYILEKEIRAIDIEIGHVNSRAKTLTSFCEKIERKAYVNPFEEINDLSGVRVVYLYASDRVHLENLVEDKFEIHEKVDKIKDQKADEFGYGALHYIVTLKERHAGARYDDLKGIKCEIQIRTILQDAWAIVAHHLSYKHEDDIPKTLRRKLHALAGMFETADDQFERINNARIEYQNNIKNSFKSDSHLLEAELNLDNLMAYISWRFPNRNPSTQDAVADLLQELNEFGYRTLKSIDDIVDKTWEAIIASEKKYPPQNLDEFEPGKYVGVGLIRSALEFVDEKYLDSRSSTLTRKGVSEFSYLLK